MNASSRRILVVDDDPDFVLQMRLPLERAGYQVFTAGGQQEAEKALGENWPDLAIVDMMMEQPDAGLALIQHIRQRRPQTPVIMVTGVPVETRAQLERATPELWASVKPDVWLEKPVRFEQLQAEVRRLLRE